MGDGVNIAARLQGVPKNRHIATVFALQSLGLCNQAARVIEEVQADAQNLDAASSTIEEALSRALRTASFRFPDHEMERPEPRVRL